MCEQPALLQHLIARRVHLLLEVQQGIDALWLCRVALPSTVRLLLQQHFRETFVVVVDDRLILRAAQCGVDGRVRVVDELFVPGAPSGAGEIVRETAEKRI